MLSDGERAFAVASEYSGDGSGGDGTNGPSCFISPSSTLSSWETERSSPGKEETFQIWKSCEFFIDQRFIPVKNIQRHGLKKGRKYRLFHIDCLKTTVKHETELLLTHLFILILKEKRCSDEAIMCMVLSIAICIFTIFERFADKPILFGIFVLVFGH